MSWKILIFVLSMTLLSFSAIGQQEKIVRGSKIVDDLTRAIYGPRTTQWIDDDDFVKGFYNNYAPVDTSVINYHHWTYTQRLSNLYQNLGNVGTSLHPIYPQEPRSFGLTSGYDSYRLFYLTQKRRFYKTKSPYTLMRLVWGGEGRALSHIAFSRNIKPKWNFSFSFRPILVDKQLQKIRQGDRQTISYYYDVQMDYETRRGDYRVQFDYSRIRHRVFENGGVVAAADPETPYAELFDSDSEINLTSAVSEKLRNNLYLSQQYIFKKYLTLYHQLEITEELDVYEDDLGTENLAYYDDSREVESENGETSFRDVVFFLTASNKIGLRGKKWKLFYDGYVRSRSYEIKYQHIKRDTLSTPMRDVEYYIGGRLRYSHDSFTHMTIWGDYLFGGYYELGAAFASRWLDVRATRIIGKPPFMHNAYRGTFDVWNNNFREKVSTHVSAFGKYKNRVIDVALGLNYTSFRNYIYFLKKEFKDTNQTVLPVQSDGRQEVLLPEIHFDFRFFRHFHLRPKLIYALVLTNTDRALRMPEWFVNLQFSYENIWFKGNLQVQLGVDFHWKSAYYALGYDAPIQQFYVQDETLMQDFFLVDVFFNAKIRRGRFFLRYHNLVQAFTNIGYIPTPSYPAQRNILDFGFEFMIFD